MSLYKKYILVIVLGLTQFFPIATVIAISIDNIPSSSSIMRDMEKRYHIDPAALQNVGEGLNVSQQKMTAPEVSVFFSPSNPVPGQEITAQAIPTYFSNGDNQLYFTWYLQHKGCEADDDDGSVPVNNANRFCNNNDDNVINQEDWKIEAMRTLANGGFDATQENYSSDTDNDGYTASLGGDGSKNIPNRCYIQDFSGGLLYELAGGSYSVTFGCPVGTTAQCVPNTTTLPCSTPAPILGDPDILTNYSICQNTNVTPTCSDSVVSCSADTTARCIPSTFVAPTCSDSGLQNTPCSSIGVEISSCSIDSSRITNPCEHLFPHSRGDTTGDGEFNRSEERFWKTDPNDPDTAGTGYGDEANVAGLGQKAFTWNYEVGDKVGVAVEGTSIIPTKHNDRSYAVMWALPKNDCPVTPANPSFYKETVHGYDVTFYRTETDINKCLKNNLIDPREGGQVGKLDVALDYTPKTPFNDASGDNFGSTLSVLGSVSNTDTPENMLHYEWKVYASTDGSFNPRGYSADPGRDTTGTWKDITPELETKNLISFTKGNGVNNLNIKLNLSETSYFRDDSGYFKVTAKVTEYNDTNQKSRSDTASVIIPIIATNQQISAKQVSFDASNKLTLGGAICDEKPITDETNPKYNPLGLGRNLCLVAKNEIIGLTINNNANLRDFQWIVNGEPLTCGNTISISCSNTSATAVTFLPITGDPGQEYEVSLTAIDAGNGKKVTLARTFQVIEPMIRIYSKNRGIAWPKYLGYYKGTDGYAYEHLSDTQFQGYSGSNPEFEVEFLPSWLENRSTWQWSLNGTPFGENAQQNPAVVPLTGNPGQIYTLSAEAVSLESPDAQKIRKALNDFWGYSVFASTEKRMSHSIQIQTVVNEEEEFSLSSPTSVFAAITKNASGQIIFVVQLFLSVLTLIVFMGILFSLSEKR